MRCRVQDLRYKEVVNICDGLRLGFVCDVIVNTATGQILAIVVPGRCKLLGMFLREDDYVIPWECIRRIGDDMILTEVNGDYRRERRPKRPFF